MKLLLGICLGLGSLAAHAGAEDILARLNCALALEATGTSAEVYASVYAESHQAVAQLWKQLDQPEQVQKILGDKTEFLRVVSALNNNYLRLSLLVNQLDREMVRTEMMLEYNANGVPSPLDRWAREGDNGWAEFLLQLDALLRQDGENPFQLSALDIQRLQWALPALQSARQAHGQLLPEFGAKIEAFYVVALAHPELQSLSRTKLLSAQFPIVSEVLIGKIMDLAVAEQASLVDESAENSWAEVLAYQADRPGEAVVIKLFRERFAVARSDRGQLGLLKKVFGQTYLRIPPADQDFYLELGEEDPEFLKSVPLAFKGMSPALARKLLDLGKTANPKLALAALYILQLSSESTPAEARADFIAELLEIFSRPIENDDDSLQQQAVSTLMARHSAHAFTAIEASLGRVDAKLRSMGGIFLARAADYSQRPEEVREAQGYLLGIFAQREPALETMALKILGRWAQRREEASPYLVVDFAQFVPHLQAILDRAPDTPQIRNLQAMVLNVNTKLGLGLKFLPSDWGGANRSADARAR